MADHDPRRPSEPSQPDEASSTRRRKVRAAAAVDPTRALFDSIGATLWTTDETLVLTFIEGLLLRRLKITPERILGRTLLDLLLDGREDHPLIQGHLTALAGHENTVRIEWAGDIYSARLAPLRDANGRITGVAGVQQIIGWMPDDDAPFREQDDRLRRAVDANIAGIIFGNEDGHITDANDAFLEIIGITREEMTTDGLSWPTLVPVEFHQRQLDAIEEIKRVGRCAPFELDLVRRDGRRVQVLVAAARLSARRREGVAFVVDVSEARRTARHLTLELSCADALLGATRPADAANAVLEMLCNELSWQGAHLWQQGGDAPFGLIARAGSSRAVEQVLQEMSRTSLEDQRTLWSAATRTLAVPLTNTSVLLLVAHPTDSPETGVISTSRAIGLRLVRALAKAS